MIRKILILSFLAVHLLIVFFRSALFDPTVLPHAVQSPMYVYCSAVGAVSYDFFAIEATTQPVVKCYMLDSDNVMRTEILGGGNGTYEYKSGIITQYTYQTPELAARLAANYCFKMHPHASVVKVTIGMCKSPSMSEYKANKLPKFSEFYQATYLHE